ncbi:MAG: hypothetical protein HKN29_16340 [Rhodothermales bacterium]|nr:hypothetical protein [Rhodothermales bacterium]
MKSRITVLVCFLIAPMIFSACASSGGTARQGQIRANLGTASRSVLISETVDALTTRYGYLMLRSVVDTEDVRFETDWRQESALADERDQGYTHARSKVTILARPRNRSGSGAQNLAVTFIAQTQVLPFGNDVWVEVEPTEMREDAIRQISNFLRRSYQTALR